ncbi:MAG: PilZ domain-containing protein [Dehalococcoidia bacterium]
MTTARALDIHVGLHVQVVAFRDGRPVTYLTTVRRADPREIRIDIPRTTDRELQAAVGDRLMLVFQQHGRALTGETKVRRIIEGPGEGLVLDAPSEVERRERREHYRLLTSIVPSVTALLNFDGEETDRIEAKILDLSGGGAQLLTHAEVPIGSQLRLVFGLDDGEVDVDVSVVALGVANPAGKGGPYRVNAQFIDLTRRMQERIVRHIFRQQTELAHRRAA